MSVWSREELLLLIADWKAAYNAVASGTSYSIGTRSLTRQDVAEIRDQLDFLQRELEALDSGGTVGSLRFVKCRTVR